MGMPKGVMLTHDAVTYDTRAVAKLLASKTCCGYETFISYLPLNHIAAQVFDVFLGLELGGCIYFPSGDVLRSGLQTALKAIKPTLFFGVPRIFEKLEEHIKQLVTQTTTWSVRYNLPMARKLMLDYHLQRTKSVIANDNLVKILCWLILCFFSFFFFAMYSIFYEGILVIP